MTTITYQPSLFHNFDAPALNEFEVIFQSLNLSPLYGKLEDDRKNGRNDNSNECMLRCLIAKIYFKHTTITSFIDEMYRNPALREVCHFTPYTRNGKWYYAPSHSAFSRFYKKLFQYKEELQNIFQQLVEAKLLSDDEFAKYVAQDGKLVDSKANTYNKKTKKDGRRDHDANFKVKKYTLNKPNGKKIIHKKKVFGYNAHILADTKTQLPIALTVTSASKSEVKVAEEMFKKLPKSITNRMEYYLADRGYDSTDLIECVENTSVTPIIDIRNMWQDTDETRQYEDTNFVYTFNGEIYYYNTKNEKLKAKYNGYHKSSDTLRYVVENEKGEQINQVAIKRKTDKRIFLKVARDSKKYKRIYNKRSAIERLNAQIDRDYKFEEPKYRSIDKLEVDLLLSFMVMYGKHEFKEKSQKETLQMKVA